MLENSSVAAQLAASPEGLSSMNLVSLGNLGDIEEIGFENLDWIYLAQDGTQRRTLVYMVMKLRIL
jgi:hypothetical protein